MTWVKLDDQFHWHPKIARLQSDAYRLFVGGLCVCNANRTGGVIWHSRFGMAAEGVRYPKKALYQLLAEGLWEKVEGGWEIHDYGVYQPTSELQREAARRAGQRSGAVRRERSVERSVEPSVQDLDERSVQRNVQLSVERNLNGIEPATRAAVPATGTSRLPVPVRPLPEKELPPVVLSPAFPAGELAALNGSFGREYDLFVAELNAATGRRFRTKSADGRKLYAQRRRDGYSADDLRAAARGVAKSAHHMGLNDNGIPYNAPANILRSKVLDQLISLGNDEIGVVRRMTADERREAEIDEWVRRSEAGE